MNLKPVYNEAKLEEFGNSMYCPDNLKGKGAEAIYAALGDPAVVGRYYSFVRMRWVRESTRRNAERKTSGGGLSIRSKLQADEFRNAVAAERAAAAVPLRVSGEKNYVRLFADTVDEREWSDVELEVRKMFLEDLEKAKKTGGCSGCKRGALVRRYVARVRELTN